MIAGFSASLSGLMAQSKRLSVSAENIANMRSRGLREDGPAEQPGAYVPRQVEEVTTAGGGVRAVERPVDPASVKVYAPSRPDADSGGVAAVPNVNLGEELVNQILAQRAYEANAAAIRTQDELTDSLLDIKT